MEEKDSCIPNNEAVKDGTENNLQPTFSKQEVKSVPQTFFASLNELGKTLDSKVSSLETKVKSSVSRVLSSHQEGEFAAPIADDIHDELQELNRALQEKLSFVHEQSSIMDSFIENTLQQYEETRQNVISVQEYAAKYGYKAKEETTFMPLDRETLEAEAAAQEREDELIRIAHKYKPNKFGSNELYVNESDSGTNARQNSNEKSEHINTLSHATKSSLPNLDCDSGTPKLLEIGLSKDTLQQMGFKFKEDKERTNNEKNTEHNAIPENCADESISSEGDSPIISILKDTRQGNTEKERMIMEQSEEITTSDISIMHVPVTNASNTSIEVSRVEISPGLIVKRPSSRKRHHLNEKHINDKENAKNDIYLDTVNRLDNKYESSAQNVREIDVPKAIIEDSPIMPTLKTVDVKKFLQDLKQSKNKSIESEIFHKESINAYDDCSSRKETTKTTPQKYETEYKGGLYQNETPSPEIPVLKTINLTNYLSNYNFSSSSYSNNRSEKRTGESHSQDIPSITTSPDVNNIENKTPDLPELATISPRSLHAMSIGKQPLYLSSSKDKAEHSIKDMRCSRKLVGPEDMSILVHEADNKNEEESPVCPILSQSSMKLLNKYK